MLGKVIHLKNCAGSYQKKIKTQYKRLRNQTRKVFAKAMRKKAEQELNNSYQHSNSVFCFLRRMKKKKNLEGRKVLERKRRTVGLY